MTFSDQTPGAQPCDGTLPEFEYEMATTDLVGEILDEITRALEAEHQRCGMTKTLLAARMGRNKSVLSRLLKGGRSLNLKTVARIVRALDHYPAFQLLPLYSEPGGNSPSWHEQRGLVKASPPVQTPTPSTSLVWTFRPAPQRAGTADSTTAVTGVQVLKREHA